MSKKEYKTPDDNPSPERLREADRQDPLGSTVELVSKEIPAGVDRRTFLMRSAVIGATAVILDSPISAQERTRRSTAPPPNAMATTLSPNLNVVKKQKGPVMTTLDE